MNTPADDMLINEAVALPALHRNWSSNGVTLGSQASRCHPRESVLAEIRLHSGAQWLIPEHQSRTMRIDGRHSHAALGAAPSMSKAFDPMTVAPGHSSLVTITLTIRMPPSPCSPGSAMMCFHRQSRSAVARDRRRAPTETSARLGDSAFSHWTWARKFPHKGHARSRSAW
jgi:hypothetical protein